MKKFWLLISLFAVAGCQPDVPESPVTQSATIPKTEQQNQSAPNSSDVQKTPEKVSVAPPNMKPEQPKPAPAKVAAQSVPIVAAPKMEPVQVAAPANAEKTVDVEPTAAIPVPKAMLSEDAAMALAKKKNCFACHTVEKKLVGPAWKAVADKYRGDAAAQKLLEVKVRKGGKGNWGSVAMPAQPALSEEELSGLVQFVLQLK